MPRSQEAQFAALGGDLSASPQLMAVTTLAGEAGVTWDSVPLGVYQGDDVRWVFGLKVGGTTPFDLTGYTAALQFRMAEADLDYMAPITPLVEITNAANGEITVTLSSELSRRMTRPLYVWDLEITQTVNSWTTTILRGTLSVTKEITRVV